MLYIVKENIIYFMELKEDLIQSKIESHSVLQWIKCWFGNHLANCLLPMCYNFQYFLSQNRKCTKSCPSEFKQHVKAIDMVMSQLLQKI